MTKAMIAVLLSALIATGCTTVESYWLKPTKYKQMPENADQNPWAATLSLDASRRLVISQRIKGDQALEARFTCPEAPPDVAMNILTRWLISASKEDTANLGASADTQRIAQVLATRTSTVELWRTTSSMYCVLLMNGWKEEAKSYLEASKAALSKTEDTSATLPEPVAFTSSAAAQGVADAKKEEEEEAKKDAEAKAAAAAAAQEAADAVKAPRETESN